MTHSINNPNKFATNDEPETSAFTPSAILDATDFPHTGLLKALNRQAAGNIVISGFNITSANATNLAVANGVILKDGKREDITLSGSMVLDSSINNLYHLLVVDDNLTKQIRNPGGVADKIPALHDGDTVIAVLKYTGSDPMQVQYLTNWKTSNSISLAHDNAGTTYTEEGQITANTGGGVDFTTTATNADIRITPNGSGKIVLDGLNWPIADGSADQVLKTDGLGQLSFVAQTSGADAISAVEGEPDLDLTGDLTIGSGKSLTIDSDLELSVSTNDAIIKNTNLDSDMIFKVNDGGVDTQVLFIDGANARVNIGTSTTPSEKLSVEGNVRMTGNIVVAGDLDHNGVNIGFFGTNVQPRQTVGNMGTSAVQTRPAPDPTAPLGFEPGVDVYVASLEQEIGNLRTKLDALIDALQLHGLIL